MKKCVFEIREQTKIARDTYRMVLAGDASDITAPGQFVNIRLDGFFLRRPISVCEKTENGLVLIYKTVGKGTGVLSSLPVGTHLDLLTGLGNGFSTAESGENPLLIGGGVGVPPLFGLAKALIAEGKHVCAVLGFRSAEDVFYVKEFEKLGVDVLVATEDGSVGVKGFVTDALPNAYSYVYTCGPEPMLRAIYRATVTEGQFSFEERMACGFGACMGCSCKTKYGNKRICRDGPVLQKEEIIW